MVGALVTAGVVCTVVGERPAAGLLEVGVLPEQLLLLERGASPEATAAAEAAAAGATLLVLCGAAAVEVRDPTT